MSIIAVSVQASLSYSCQFSSGMSVIAISVQASQIIAMPYSVQAWTIQNHFSSGSFIQNYSSIELVRTLQSDSNTVV